MTRRIVPPPAYAPPACSEVDAMALKALQAGNANPDQQRRALAWIVNDAARYLDQPYRPGPDGDRETAFVCGRQFVGQQIVHQLNTVRVKKEPA